MSRKRQTAAPETIEKLLEVFDSPNPQDQEALQQTLLRLHAVILSSREQLRRHLRAIPDADLLAAWEQGQADAALKKKEYAPPRNQLSLDLPSSPRTTVTVKEQTPPFTTVSENPETFSTARPVTVDEVFEFLRAKLKERVIDAADITSPEAVKQYLTTELAQEEREIFGVLFLNTKHNPIAFERLFQGTIDSCNVYPRDIAKRALQLNAAAIILVHNHPSGNPEPSRADCQMTERVKTAMQLFDIRLLDHIIIAGAKTTSLAEQRML